MNALAMGILLALAVSVGFAQECSAGDDKPAPEQAKDKTESPVAAAAKDEEEFKTPPGFRAKKRGGTVLYCTRDSTVGTRFKTEKCFDESQLKAYLLAREQDSREIEQRRSICSGCASQ